MRGSTFLLGTTSETPSSSRHSRRTLSQENGNMDGNSMRVLPATLTSQHPHICHLCRLLSVAFELRSVVRARLGISPFCRPPRTRRSRPSVSAHSCSSVCGDLWAWWVAVAAAVRSWILSAIIVPLARGSGSLVHGERQQRSWPRVFAERAVPGFGRTSSSETLTSQSQRATRERSRSLPTVCHSGVAFKWPWTPRWCRH